MERREETRPREVRLGIDTKKDPIYRAWGRMLERVRSTKKHNSHRYVERGIGVCPEWELFTNFDRDMRESFQKGLTLDCVDNDKGYCKNNCKWATPKEQANNRSTTLKVVIDNEELTFQDAHEKYGKHLERQTIQFRLKKGWEVKRAFTEEVGESQQVTVTIDGVEMLFQQAYDLLKCTLLKATVNARLRKGWDHKLAFTSPLSNSQWNKKMPDSVKSPAPAAN